MTEREAELEARVVELREALRIIRDICDIKQQTKIYDLCVNALYQDLGVPTALNKAKAKVLEEAAAHTIDDEYLLRRAQEIREGK